MRRQRDHYIRLRARHHPVIVTCIFSIVDQLTEEPERRSVLCTVCVDILSQVDDSEEYVRALRLEMLSDDQIPDARAKLRYDKRAIAARNTVSPWLIRALVWSVVQSSQACVLV
jgi:hypothetical protein